MDPRRIPQHTEEIIHALQETLTGDPRFAAIRLAILYGSVARGTHRTDSDIDLALCTDPRITIDDDTLLAVVAACEKATGREVQVRDLARAHGVFLKEALTTGKVIHQTESRVRGELIIRMLSFVEDLLPAIRNIRARKKERFLAG
ncbi:MAG: nucleotidyltransferase domain-containing protein [Spirochaeta sp.]|nr:nucleotidyltransferase domain-containing protein [Spirochaeta sp.]